jgi:hypothetical protein
MKNISINQTSPSRKGTLIRNLVMLLAALMWLPSMAQENTNTTVYTFMVLKDGTHVSGKILSKTETEIEVMDFALGKLTIKMSQVVTENDLETGNSYCFKMSGGQEYCGMVMNQNDSSIQINTASIGKISLVPSTVHEVSTTEDRKVVNGQVWFKNPHGTRYLYMPTAIPLKKGEGYYQNSMLLLNTINYGVTDHLSIGGGFLVPVAFMGTAKVGYEVAHKVHIGGGGVVAGGFGGLNFGIGAGYGEITFGDENINCSVAGGMGFSKQETYDYSNHSYSRDWKFGKNPMFSISGMARVSNRVALVTENWFIPTQVGHYNGYNSPTTYTTEYQALNAFGFRVMWEKNSLDFAMVRMGGFAEGLMLPYINYVFKF